MYSLTETWHVKISQSESMYWVMRDLHICIKFLNVARPHHHLASQSMVVVIVTPVGVPVPVIVGRSSSTIIVTINIFIGYVFSLLYDYTSPHPEIHPNPNPIHPSIYSTIVSKLFCSATWRFDHYYNNDHNPLLSQSTWQRRCSARRKVQGCFS